MDAKHIIDAYINLIKDKPQEYKEDYARAKEYISTTNAYQFGKPIPFNYQPIFISQKDAQNFEEISKTILTIGSKVLKKYIEDEEYRKLFDFPKYIEEMIQIDPGYKVDFPMARIDVFYQDEENFELCEINTDGSAGMNADTKIAQALLQSKGLQDFSKNYKLSSFDLFQPWVDSCLEIYKEFDSTIEKPNVAIIDFTESATGPDFEEFVKAFERNGLNCKVVDVRQMEYKQGNLYFEDYKIDLIYRRMVTFELINHVNECQDFIQAYRNQAVCVVGSLRTQIIHNKLFFKILFDKETKEILSPEENEFVEKHVPYTGILGEKEEDMELLINNKDDYIIKPMDANKSTGVYTGKELDQKTWEENLREGAGKGNIFQKFVPPYYDEYVNLEKDSLEIEKLTNMMGLFSYNHSFVGTYNRMGTSTIIKPGYYKVAPGILAVEK